MSKNLNFSEKLRSAFSYIDPDTGEKRRGTPVHERGSNDRFGSDPLLKPLSSRFRDYKIQKENELRIIREAAEKEARNRARAESKRLNEEYKKVNDEVYKNIIEMYTKWMNDECKLVDIFEYIKSNNRKSSYKSDKNDSIKIDLNKLSNLIKLSFPNIEVKVDWIGIIELSYKGLSFARDLFLMPPEIVKDKYIITRYGNFYYLEFKYSDIAIAYQLMSNVEATDKWLNDQLGFNASTMYGRGKHAIDANGKEVNLRHILYRYAFANDTYADYILDLKNNYTEIAFPTLYIGNGYSTDSYKWLRRDQLYNFMINGIVPINDGGAVYYDWNHENIALTRKFDLHIKPIEVTLDEIMNMSLKELRVLYSDYINSAKEEINNLDKFLNLIKDSFKDAYFPLQKVEVDIKNAVLLITKPNQHDKSDNRVDDLVNKFLKLKLVTDNDGYDKRNYSYKNAYNLLGLYNQYKSSPDKVKSLLDKISDILGKMKLASSSSNFSERLMKCFSSNSELDKLGFIKGFKDISINFPHRYRDQVLYTRNLDNSVEYLFTKDYYGVLALAQEEHKINPNIIIGRIVLDKVPYTLMTCEKAGDLSKVIPKDVAIKIIQLWDKNKKLHDLEGFVDSEEDGNEFDRLLESCGLNDDKYAEYSAPEIVEACRSII